MELTGLLLLALILQANALYCVDENNEQVDWFVAYKFPIANKKNPNQYIHQGVGYAYITSKNTSSWILPENGINETSSLIAKTLSSLYDSNSVTSWNILYNDQPPEASENTKKGHTKGVVLGDDSGGFWMVHSVPHFPYKPSDSKEYKYPSTGTMFGQSFLCISLDPNQLNTVGKLLQTNEIHVYNQNVPYVYKATHPDLYNAAMGLSNLEPISLIQNITSLNGVSFTSFAKNRYFKKDLYDELVAPYYGDVFYVETWPNGPGRLTSNCSLNYSVQNVEQINFDFLATKTIFKSTHDHSKWALCEKNDLICIGDINRESTQFKRGGGTVCFKNSDIAGNYKKTIMQLEACPKNYTK